MDAILFWLLAFKKRDIYMTIYTDIKEEKAECILKYKTGIFQLYKKKTELTHEIRPTIFSS